MSDDEDEIEIPDDEAALIEMLETEDGEGLTEQEKNVAIAQAELIGDL